MTRTQTSYAARLPHCTWFGNWRLIQSSPAAPWSCVLPKATFHGCSRVSWALSSATCCTQLAFGFVFVVVVVGLAPFAIMRISSRLYEASRVRISCIPACAPSGNFESISVIVEPVTAPEGEESRGLDEWGDWMRSLRGWY